VISSIHYPKYECRLLAVVIIVITYLSSFTARASGFAFFAIGARVLSAALLAALATALLATTLLAAALLAAALLATTSLFLLTATAATFLAGAWAVALRFRARFQFLAVGHDEDALAFVGGLFHFQRRFGGGRRRGRAGLGL